MNHLPKELKEKYEVESLFDLDILIRDKMAAIAEILEDLDSFSIPQSKLKNSQKLMDEMEHKSYTPSKPV